MIYLFCRGMHLCRRLAKDIRGRRLITFRAVGARRPRLRTATVDGTNPRLATTTTLEPSERQGDGGDRLRLWRRVALLRFLGRPRKHVDDLALQVLPDQDFYQFDFDEFKPNGDGEITSLSQAVRRPRHSWEPPLCSSGVPKWPFGIWRRCSGSGLVCTDPNVCKTREPTSCLNVRERQTIAVA